MRLRQHQVELALLLRKASVVLLPFLVLLLCLPPYLSAMRDARDVSAQFAEITHRERERWLNQNPKNPHSADHFGTWVFRPVAPLSPLDQGVSPYFGRMVRIEAHVFNDPVFQAAQDSNPLMRSGFSSVSDVLQLLLPLAALILGFAAFASDKERGTIRLALGNGASPRQWVGARLSALALICSASIGVPLALLGLLAIGGDTAEGAQTGIRLLIWLLVYVVYANIFLLLGMAIALVCRNLRTALTAVLLVWFVACIAAPRVAVLIVSDLAPTPSYQATRAVIDAETRAFNAAEVSAQRERDLLAQYGVKREQDMPVDLRGLMLHARDQHDYGVFDRHFGAFYDRLQRQERMFGLAGILSPRTATEAASEALAGNDFANQVHFVWAAERYRRALSDTMNAVLMASPQAKGETIKTGREVWEQVPPFEYDPLSLQQSLASAWAPLLFLLIWLGAAGGLVFVLASRMKP